MIGLLTSLILLGGIGFAIWTGAGMAINPAERAEMDFARVAKSAGLAVALGLALAGVTNGLIQLLQGIVGGTRIEGSNDDLAFGLSMLIVSAPVFFLIARYLDQQRISRNQEGKNPIGIGWSVHYVACSSVLLVGVLSSAGIVIDDMFRNGFSNRDVQADEVAQLIGWLAVYLTYWFGMRPRFGVRGYVHLLVGTILGLIWIVGSIWALAHGLLGQAYDSLFREPVVDTTSLTVLIPPGIIGVWLSHWRILNGNGNRIETNPNRSQSWFATVVGLAIVPAVIMLISLGTALVASVLVWFLGSTSESAADYFAYVPTLVVGALISFAVWAYHRSLVIAGGSPTRTESLRFHDYAVAAVGLGAVVVGIARLVNHAFEALARRQAIADTYGVGNNVIITLCLLAVGSASRLALVPSYCSVPRFCFCSSSSKTCSTATLGCAHSAACQGRSGRSWPWSVRFGTTTAFGVPTDRSKVHALPHHRRPQLHHLTLHHLTLLARSSPPARQPPPARSSSPTRRPSLASSSRGTLRGARVSCSRCSGRPLSTRPWPTARLRFPR